MTTYKTTASNRSYSTRAYAWFAIAVILTTGFSSRALASGADTYKAKCGGCHGPDGSGATAMGKKFKLRDLRSPEVQKQSDADLQGIIANGKSPMPAFAKSLDSTQVQELVAYVRSVATK